MPTYLHVHRAHKCSNFLAHLLTHPEARTRTILGGVSHAVVIVPKATEYNRGLQLTACCAVTLETHKRLGVKLSLEIKFNRSHKLILSIDKQKMSHACVSGCI